MKKYFQGCTVNRYINITSIFTIFERTCDSSYYFDGESHDFWEFVCVLDGILGVTAGEDVLSLEKGQFVLHRPMEFHRLWSEKKTTPRILVISFAADVMPQMNEKSFYLKEEEYKTAAGFRNNAHDIFQITERYLVKGVHPGKEIEAQIFVSAFENLLLRVFARKDSRTDLHISTGAANYRLIVRTLEAHITERLTQSDIAQMCSMSEASLKKTFSRYAGIGIMTYFTQMKIRHAVEMLESGASIGETADVLGFCDGNYFSTVFKRVTGTSPTSYVRERNCHKTL